jgi:D-alanine transaminase
MHFDDHIDRIYRSAKLIDIDIPMPKEEMKAMLQSLVDQVEGDSLFLYWQVTRGVGMRNHPFRGVDGKASVWAWVRPNGMRNPYGVYKCITMEDTRFLHCNIKTINLLPAVIANQRAEEAGCDETIFHRGDRVTECSHSNVHIIKDGALITAPLDNPILPGIVRKHIIELCHELGIPVREEPYTVEDLMNADEVLFSSSSALTSRVCEIDGKPVGMKDEKTFAAIRDAYQALLDREYRA